MEYRVDYGQMSNTQSDYVVPDGTMHLAVDAELQNGDYMAARVPKEACNEYTDFIPLYIHRLSNPQKEFTCGLKYNKEDGNFRFIIRGDGTDYDILGEDEAFTLEGYDDELMNFCAIGNILSFTLHGEAKFVYYLDETFKLFNRLPPRPALKLTVMRRYSPKVSPTSSEIVEPTQEYVNCNRIEVDCGSDGSALVVSIDGSKVYNNTELTMTKLLESDENIKKMEDRVFGALNSARAQIMKKGYLMFPVMLRYAYRLYDGSTIMASQPILMYPMLPHPYLFYTAWQKFKNYSEAADGYDITGVKGLSFFFEAYRIFANIEDSNIISELKQWDGIVKSIDIFISPQMYTIESDELDYSMFEGNGSATSPFKPQQAKVRLKERNIKDTIEGVSAFHLVKSIDINELNKIVYSTDYDNYHTGTNDYSNFNEFSRVLPDDLTNYTEKETLNDSIYDNSLIAADTLLSYNKRLLCGGVTRWEPSDYDIGKLYPQIFNESSRPQYSEVYKATYYNGSKMNTIKDLITKETSEDFALTRGDSFGVAAYEVTDNGKVTYITSNLATTDLPKFLSFPGNKLTAFVLISSDEEGNEKAFRIPLKRSDILDVSYDYPFKQTIRNSDTTVIPSITTMDKYAEIETGHLIKESEVNNPFVFKDGNSASCGSGKILAIANNALPVNTGQFGQYPLFAFCTDGVFAIQVGANGTLQSCVPYSYDILVDKHSICNVERSIVFITKRGVVAIGDGRTLLLDADKRARYAFDNDAQKTFITKTCADMGLTLPDLTDLPSYLTTGARMAYDSAHARLIVFNPKYAYSYVYNYTEQAWCVITETFALAVNDADQCKLVRLVSDDAEKSYTSHVYDYSTDDVVEKKSALLVSRPLKMSAPDTLKTVSSVIQRGVFDQGHIAQAIYGSNDNRRWISVKSSNGERMEAFSGSGYKFFRLVVFIKNFAQDESISGCSVNVDGRMTNKLR